MYQQDVNFDKFSEASLKQAVGAGMYPPTINMVVIHERPPDPTSAHSMVHLYINGPKEGCVEIPFWVYSIDSETEVSVLCILSNTLYLDI